MLKLPVPIIIDDELTKALMVELPTLKVDVALVRFAIPSEVTAVAFTTKFDPIV